MLHHRKPRYSSSSSSSNESGSKSYSSSPILPEDDVDVEDNQPIRLAWWMHAYMIVSMLLLIAAVVLIAITLADVETFHHKVKDAVKKYDVHKMFTAIHKFDPEKMVKHALSSIGSGGGYYPDDFKHEKDCKAVKAYSYRPYESQFLGLPFGRYRKSEAGEPSSDPNPRYISNYVMAYGKAVEKAGERCDIMPNKHRLSAWIWQWGQFVDHEFALTRAGEQFGSFEIDIKCDEVADPHCKGKSIHMSRSKYVADGDGVRQQINELSAFLDASAVYGSTYDRYKHIRAYKDGKLKVSEGEFLPYNEYGLPNEGGDERKDLFLGGDVRANEQLGLTCVHTLWVREHNSWASKLHKNYPDWSDEQLYWTARRIVTAEIQSITYHEWLPALLGKAARPEHYNSYKQYGMPPAHYNKDVNVDMKNGFATAAYRFGHSMVGESLLLYNPKQHKHKCLPLKDAFFKPSNLHEYGIDAVLAGLSVQPAEELDVLLVDSLRNFLHFAEFIDLASLNIMRGRDHGLPYYHELYYSMTGKYIKSWSDITSDKALQKKLKDVYGDWEHIDAWVGILAEDHVDDSSLGITGTSMLIDQFRRIRDGDAYYYEWDSGLPEAIKGDIHTVTLYDIILRNSELKPGDIPEHVFYAE